MCALGRTSKENICFAPSRVRSNGSQISCVSIRVYLNDSELWARFSRICVYLVTSTNCRFPLYPIYHYIYRFDSRISYPYILKSSQILSIYMAILILASIYKLSFTINKNIIQYLYEKYIFMKNKLKI